MVREGVRAIVPYPQISTYAVTVTEAPGDITEQVKSVHQQGS